MLCDLTKSKYGLVFSAFKNSVADKTKEQALKISLG